MAISVKRIGYVWGFFCCAALVFWVVAPKPLQAEGQVPLTQLEEIVNEIIEILESGDLEKDWEQKRQRIIPLIDERLNLTEIARRALGRHWRNINAEQRQEFTSLFVQLLRDTYINRLCNCSHENEVRFYEQRTRGDKAIVYSMVKKDQQEIPIDYRLIEIEGEWGIYDIVVEGVSLINNYRTQFDQIMNRGGYSELISRLREKTGNGV